MTTAYIPRSTRLAAVIPALVLGVFTLGACGQPGDERDRVEPKAVAASKTPTKPALPALAEGKPVDYTVVASVDQDTGEITRTTMQATLLKTKPVESYYDGYETNRPEPGNRWVCLKLKMKNTGTADGGGLGTTWTAQTDDGEQIDGLDMTMLTCPSYEKPGADITEVDAGSYVIGWVGLEIPKRPSTATMTDGVVWLDEPVDLFTLRLP